MTTSETIRRANAARKNQQYRSVQSTAQKRTPIEWLHVYERARAFRKESWKWVDIEKRVGVRKEKINHQAIKNGWEVLK